MAEKTNAEELLKEGYIEMAAEVKNVARAFRSLDQGSLKYID